MSRSRRKTPVANHYGCKSERISKIIWHRRMRNKIRCLLRSVHPDELWLPLEREVIDVWAMGKDGKWRFDPTEYPKLMRK